MQGEPASSATGGKDQSGFSFLPDGWKPPDLTLIIAATPRSGSNFLAESIDSTGLFRGTTEYFNDAIYVEKYGLKKPSLARKLLEMDRESRTGSNFLSTKLFPDHIEDVRRSGILSAAFNNARYVHLSRRDVLGQAISMAIALETGSWTSLMAGNGRILHYDETAISRAIAALVRAEGQWTLYFASRDVPVIHIVYEDLEANPAREIRRIVSFLGFDPERYPVNSSMLRFKKQRGGESEEWRRRYLSSNCDPQEYHLLRPLPRTIRNVVRFLKGELRSS